MDWPTRARVALVDKSPLRAVQRWVGQDGTRKGPTVKPPESDPASDGQPESKPARSAWPWANFGGSGRSRGGPEEREIEDQEIVYIPVKAAWSARETRASHKRHAYLAGSSCHLIWPVSDTVLFVCQSVSIRFEALESLSRCPVSQSGLLHSPDHKLNLASWHRRPPCWGRAKLSVSVALCAPPRPSSSPPGWLARYWGWGRWGVVTLEPTSWGSIKPTRESKGNLRCSNMAPTAI